MVDIIVICAGVSGCAIARELSRAMGVPMGEIIKSGGNSRLIVGVNKDNV